MASERKLTAGDQVRHKPWFRGVFAGVIGTVRKVRADGTIEVDFPQDPFPEARVYDAFELVVAGRAALASEPDRHG